MAGHALAVCPALGSRQQPPGLVNAQRAAVVPAVGADVQPVQMLDGAFSCPAVANHPPAELLERGKVEVEGLGTDPPLYLLIAGLGFHLLILPLIVQPTVGPARLNVGPLHEPAALGHASRSPRHKLRVGFGVALGHQRRLEVGQVIGQQLCLSIAAGVDNAPLEQCLADAGGPRLHRHGYGRVGAFVGLAALYQPAKVSR
ncbi:hypothetical protein ACERK3_16900 [Phycisphaerales bacterium AB-hyl4]|uniref:Uncharacterized protein n=1 Tax=Natronomicrosphaera hydrolytica TaxID=3242702 RepID=A0ABV4U8U4_9BACT